MGLMADKIAGTFQRSDHEEVRAAESTFKNTEYFSFRVWYKEEPNVGKLDAPAEWRPSRNGINLRVDEGDDFLRLIVRLFGRDRIAEALDKELTNG
jgi:hypothetical protein